MSEKKLQVAAKDPPLTIAVEPPPPPELLVYIGPTLLLRGLVQFTVYSGGIPAFVVEQQLRDLFVPVSRFSEARVALDVKGSVEWIAFQAAVAAFSKSK